MPHFSVKYWRVYNLPTTELDSLGMPRSLDIETFQQGEVIVDAKNFGDAEAKVVKAFSTVFWDVEVRMIQLTPKGVVPTILK